MVDKTNMSTDGHKKDNCPEANGGGYNDGGYNDGGFADSTFNDGVFENPVESTGTWADDAAGEAAAPIESQW
jgi:hypothetical protein